MKELSDIIKNRSVSKITNERADIIRQFTEEINKERVKKIAPKVVAIKLSHIKDKSTLYYFLSQCKDYKNRRGSFGKYFWGCLKVQNDIK